MMVEVLADDELYGRLGAKLGKDALIWLE